MKKEKYLSSQAKVTIVLFFGILTLLWIFNYNTDTEKRKVESTRIEDLESEPLNSLISVRGTVSDLYTTKHGIINLSLSDGADKVDVSIFPNIGIIEDEIKLGYELKVNGLLSKYRNTLQIQPLSNKSIYVLDRDEENTELPKVSIRELKEYVDKRVFIGPVEVLDFEHFISTTGKEHIRLEVEQDNLRQSAIIFDGGWTEEDINILNQFNFINAIANVETFNGELSLDIEEIYSVSESDLQENVITKSEKENLPYHHSEAIDLSKVHEYMNQEILIGPVQFNNMREFTSNAGKTHLQFSLQQNGTTYDAIMFENAWGEREKGILKSSGQFYVSAEISTFNGDISIVVKDIEE